MVSEDPLSNSQEYAAELESRMQWISVAERLPADGDEVIVYFPRWVPDRRGGWFGNVTTATRRLDGWAWESAHDDEFWPTDSVTHWMPLPEPPK